MLACLPLSWRNAAPFKARGRSSQLSAACPAASGAMFKVPPLPCPGVMAEDGGPGGHPQLFNSRLVPTDVP